MALPYELHLALRYLRGHAFLSVITLISLTGVAVGSAALVIALALNAGFVDDVRARIHSGSAHLTVMSAEQLQFPEGEALAARLESMEGVRATAPVLYTPGLITLESVGSHGFAEIQGVDPLRQARVIPAEDGADAPFELLTRPTSSGRAPIVLGAQLAARLHAVNGDAVRVLVPELTLAPWGAMPRSQLFEVVGSYASSHFQEDATRAYVEIDAARRLLRKPGQTQWIEVRLDDLRQLEVRKEALRAALAPDWLVVDLLEANRDLLKALNTEKLILFLAIGLIVVVASLNIVSTLLLMVADKIKEIGALTAMGARTSGIAVVFMLQGLVIGVAGATIGLALGAATSIVLDRYRLIRLDPDVYYLTHIPFDVRTLDLVSVGLAALVISFLATLYPSLKAARLDPVEALRHE